MSYARLCRSEEELRHEVERLLAEAEREDRQEDQRYGAGRGMSSQPSSPSGKAA